MDAVLADWRTAPVGEGLRETLGLLQRVTLHPDEVARDHVDRVRAAGVGDEAIVDALYVCAAFNLIDRVADALGFEVPPAEYFRAVAADFLREGYSHGL